MRPAILVVHLVLVLTDHSRLVLGRRTDLVLGLADGLNVCVCCQSHLLFVVFVLQLQTLVMSDPGEIVIRGGRNAFFSTALLPWPNQQ